MRIFQVTHFKIIRSILFFSTVFSFFSINTLKAEEFEIWTFAGAETQWRNMGISLRSANFFLQDGNWFLNHTEFSLIFPSKNNFSLGLAYKQEYVKFPERIRAEYRPMINLFYTRNWGYFQFKDRNRWEFRFMDGELINRYRNQVLFTYNKFKSFAPYFSTEFSFYFNKLDYTRQRTIIGANIPIKSVTLNLFLGHQFNKDLPDTWTDKIMLGTSFNYRF